jgi:hypothetical protein
MQPSDGQPGDSARRASSRRSSYRRADGHDCGVNAEAIHCLILYRTPRGWRTTVGGPEGIACGGLPDAPADAPFALAERDFRAVLREAWGFDHPITWTQTKPEWWGADVRAAPPA